MRTSMLGKPTAATSPAHLFEKALLEFEPSARSTACLGRKHRKARACALTPWWRQSGANSVSEPKFPVIQGKYREFAVLWRIRHQTGKPQCGRITT